MLTWFIASYKGLSSLMKLTRLYSLRSNKDLMKFKAVTLMLTWFILAAHSTFDENPCTRIRILAATMTVMMMRTWLVFENVWESLGDNDSFYKNNESTSCFQGNFLRDFLRESLCDNAENASEQRSFMIVVIATFQENPCARMQKMYPSNGRPGPLSSPLFKRIPVRE